MYQSIKARIYLTDAQSEKLSQFFGCARWWWNRAASDTTTTYAQTGNRFFPSSKTCSNCYHRVPSLPLEVRQWTCSLCGTSHDRDVNAAQNLKAEGLRILSLGTSETADGGKVRPSRGRKTSVRHSPSKSEARSLSVG